MNLTNHFLVSTGNVGGSFFAHSVIYVCRHDEDGAFGIIINKPSDTSVQELLKALKIDSATASKGMVFQGGPVKPEQVFILHSPPDDFDVTIKIDEEVGVTLSRDILTAISENRAPSKMIFAFGYAGWEKGQLEEEITSNAWITLPASPDIIFDMPPKTRFAEAGKRLGFDITHFSDLSGHA